MRCCCRTAITRCRRRPGYRVYYLWALSGDARRLVPYEDPQHRGFTMRPDVEHARSLITRR